MKSMDDTLKIVVVILSISTSIMPVIAGFVLWQFSKVFITREQFEDFKKVSHDQREDMKVTLIEIKDDLRDLMQKG